MKITTRLKTLGLAALVTTAIGSAAMAQPTDRGITVALAVELDSLDACDTQPAQNANIARGNIYQSLTHVSPVDGKVEPLLALSWERVDDLTWEFKLRPDVKFHDGTPFNAEAAAANINRSQPGFKIDGAEIACLNVVQFPEAVTAEAVDELTLRVTTPKSDPILPLRLTYADIGSLATQQTVEKATNPVGTGPYKFVERIQGETVKLTRFDEYWGELPQVKDVAYVFRAEASVRAGMIATGEAQLATAISGQDATDDGRTVTYKDNRIVIARPNSFKEPFLDPRVRQAVSYAIDRDTIVPALMGITGNPWYQMLGPQVNGYIPGFDDTEALRFNLEKAKELIAAAKADGHPVDQEFNLVTRPDLFPGSDEVVQAIAQNLQAAGLNPKILSLENTAWRVYLRQPFPEDQPGSITMISHDNTSGDATFSFSGNYATCEGRNSATCNPEIDRLVFAADAAEGDERAKLYQDAARIMYLEESTMIGVAEQVRLMMLGEGIDYQPNPLSGIEIRIADIKFTN
jgi:peptide/nickel transport system substrate-binding protein